MCGITGFWAKRTLDLTKDRARELLETMTTAIAHRGPDDAGTYFDGDSGVGLGHRRLSILDLSPHGHQPMTSRGGRYVISFNGEVYNFESIRKELEKNAGKALPWRGGSDTEVMLAAFEQWGLVASLEKFVGMFAFALWDRQERALHLVRDRVGIKPLYVAHTDAGVAFGSELKSIVPFPGFNRRIDRAALSEYVRLSCVPAPLSIYEQARKVVPGTIVTLRGPTPADATENTWWSAAEVAEQGLRDPFKGTEDDAVRELDTLLRDAVRLRMIADVPVGVFLSGGIDSSTVVSVMQAESSRPVHSFSIGSPNAQYDESHDAAKVARHIGTHHTELVVTPQNALSVIPELPKIYDEPFADSSQIPTFLVSRLARKEVTVALSGDGGDELFGGYNRHVFGPLIWNVQRPVPRLARRAAASLLTAFSPTQWDRTFARARSVLPRTTLPGHHIHKLATMLNTTSVDAMYDVLASHWTPAEVLTETRRHANGASKDPKLDGIAHLLMYRDLVKYLPDDILAKVDRASMAVSLEAREPLLDHRLIAFAWRLPLKMKIRNRSGKRLLRRVLHQYVPPELVDRPKMGFGIPLADWLRGDLKEWAWSLLRPERLSREGLFNAAAVHARWDEHQSGQRNWEYHLWDVLMFQAWADSNRPA